MGRIELKFEELKKNNKKALITFVTAGDPDMETTKKLIFEMEAKGADIIELGIPYSDPIAEGPVIQKANSRALLNGIGIKDIFNEIESIREKVKVPLVLLLYFNCIFKYGTEKFFCHCKKAGIDGLIIPDLPFEERWELEDISARFDVDIITMVAPTSHDRIEKIVRNARGFLYCVSSLGVTGVRQKFQTNFDEFISNIEKFSSLPKAIGFGISTPEHIRALKQYSDGLIVGSAIVRKVEESPDTNGIINNVGSYVKSLRDALDE